MATVRDSSGKSTVIKQREGVRTSKEDGLSDKVLEKGNIYLSKTLKGD